MHSFDKHIGDYTRDTVGLSMVEDGAYGRLLDQYYASELPLPRDQAELYRMARAFSAGERKAVDYVLAKYFVLREDGWHNNRADIEIANFHTKSGKAKDAADLRWQRERDKESYTNAHANAYANASVSHGIRNANPRASPRTTSHEPRTDTPKTPAAFQPPDWVPQQEWADFDEMRSRKSGKAWTLRARELAVGELGRLMAAGEDAAAVLRQSVLRSWAGLFPIDHRRSRDPPTKQSLAERRVATLDAITGQRNGREITGTAERMDCETVPALPQHVREQG